MKTKIKGRPKGKNDTSEDQRMGGMEASTRRRNISAQALGVWEEARMTVCACPAGCGGFINTEVSQVCSGCRYPANEQRVKVDDDWCWEWFGPSFHRMKCRRILGHSGECHDHPDDELLCIASFADRKFDYERKDDGLLYVVSMARGMG